MCKIRHLRQPADPSDKFEDVKMRKCGNVRMCECAKEDVRIIS